MYMEGVMAVKEIEKKDWQSYFDSFYTKYLKDDQPEYAEIRVLSDESGAQPETSWLLLEGISFDPKDDVLDIRVEKLNRMIWHPRCIYVDEHENSWITSMEVIGVDGTKDIIELR